MLIGSSPPVPGSSPLVVRSSLAAEAPLVEEDLLDAFPPTDVRETPMPEYRAPASLPPPPSSPPLADYGIDLRLAVHVNRAMLANPTLDYPISRYSRPILKITTKADGTRPIYGNQQYSDPCHPGMQALCFYSASSAYTTLDCELSFLVADEGIYAHLNLLPEPVSTARRPTLVSLAYLVLRNLLRTR
jgi:hypothetical protein